MVGNVFGSCITNATLTRTGVHRGSNSYSQQQRAEIALKMKNAEGKDVAASNFVKKLRDEFGRHGDKVSVMCLFYNATGDTITIFRSKSYEGCVGESPIPIIIENGQWGAFLYTETELEDTYEGCKACVCYTGLNSEGNSTYWFTAFFVRYHTLRNAVSVDIQQASEAGPNFANMAEKLSNGEVCGNIEDLEDASIFASIGDSKSPMLEVIMTLPAAEFFA